MLAFLLGLFRMVWLFGKDHRGVVLENLALRHQLAIYKRKHKRPRFVDRDRWFWVTLSVLWKDWRRALVVVHPDTVVRWQRERFRRYWHHLSPYFLAGFGRGSHFDSGPFFEQRERCGVVEIALAFFGGYVVDLFHGF
jgi:hypothetical protein